MIDDYDADLFAGPGGWDVAARRLSRRPIGIEWDRHTCATRAAAGLLTIRASVADYPPERFAGRARGLIASPPCPAFSRAGSGQGKPHLEALITAAQAGDWTARPSDDPLVWLSLEPGRWIEAIRPEWVAMEQAPSVKVLWDGYAVRLRALGYSVWTGVLSSETFGVPQVRKRAVLIASRTRTVGAPEPTHRAFDPRVRDVLPPDLFGLPPFVTMGEALGWTAENAEGVVLNPGLTDTQPNRRVWPVDGPSPTIAFGHDVANWRWERRNDQSESGEGDPFWPLARPATTIAGRALVPDPGANANRFNGKAKSRNDGYRVTVAEMATLQSFPADHPWAGPVTKQALQVGNAVPPLMAEAILKEAIG